VQLDRDKLLELYTSMVRARTFETRLIEAYEDGFVPGHVHIGIGQEATAVGGIAAIRADDYFTSSHRGDKAHLIARGENPGVMMAEAFGRSTGCNKGKGGHIHFGNLRLGDIGSDGILGTTQVIAPGVALASKLRGTDQVTLCFFGDGCVNTGGFHEGVNLAAVWKLPVIFICENNTWAESTSIYDTTALKNLADRTMGYGIPGITVDGNDVLAVYEAVSEAITRARRGEGPSLIECVTCRWRGHFEGELQSYRTKEDLAQCQKRDPIPRFQEKLVDMGVLSGPEATAIRERVREEMEGAFRFAKESPFPEPGEAFTDVYA
jgi:acetoin:2,6-dichlorophenolindophenol oxidoreductase subunit alpha